MAAHARRAPCERIHKNIKLIFKCVQKTQAARRRTKQQKINALFLLTSIVWWQENFKHISERVYRVFRLVLKNHFLLSLLIWISV